MKFKVDTSKTIPWQRANSLIICDELHLLIESVDGAIVTCTAGPEQLDLALGYVIDGVIAIELKSNCYEYETNQAELCRALAPVLVMLEKLNESAKLAVEATTKECNYYRQNRSTKHCVEFNTATKLRNITGALIERLQREFKA